MLSTKRSITGKPSRPSLDERPHPLLRILRIGQPLLRGLEFLHGGDGAVFDALERVQPRGDDGQRGLGGDLLCYS